MRKAVAVIGANYGDEGKGHMVDYFVSQRMFPEDTLVVRFNGGAQAGHTVIRGDKRHVFGHYGSGTLAGAPTLLSKFFVVNPLLMQKEAKELETIGFKPTLYIDEECRVTTPWDMALNQAIEDCRGNKRHGSCGVGLHETVLRHAQIPITVRDLRNRSCLDTKLYLIQHEYQAFRLKEMNANYSLQIAQYLDHAHERFFESVQFLLDTYKPWTGLKHEDIVFEGAQGLLLDANHRFFPHVTCSKTGLHNVLMLLSDFFPNNFLDRFEVVYVSRCYATRHGRGLFPHELACAPYGKMLVDETNITNPYQENFKYAWLDFYLLHESVSNDCRWSRIPRTLALTCLDQMEGEVGYYYGSNNDDVHYAFTPDEFVDDIFRYLHLGNKNFRDGYVSKGPRAEDVSRICFEYSPA